MIKAHFDNKNKSLKMNARLFPFCMLQLCLFCLTIASGQEGDWTEIYNKVYATQGESLEPETTADLLRRLLKVYEDEPDAALMRKNLRSLIEAGNIDETKCDKNTIMSLNELIQSYKMYSVNLMPYLKHCKDDLYYTCEEIFEDELEESINSLDKQERIKILLLRKSVSESIDESLDVDKQYLSIPRSSIEEGIITYMEPITRLINPADESDVKISKDKFINAFENWVVNLCERVTWAIDAKIGLFMDDEELVGRMDKKTLTWMTNWRLCRDVQRDMVNIASETYELIGREPEKPSKVGRKRKALLRLMKKE